MDKISLLSEPFNALKAARDVLKQQESRLANEIAQLDQVIATLQAMHGEGAEVPKGLREPTPDLTAAISAREIKGLTHAGAMKLLLSRSSKPLTIRQMMAMFERSGRRLSRKNGYRVLYKTLHAHKEFAAENGAWRVAGES